MVRCLPVLLLALTGHAADVVIGAGRGFLRVEDGLTALKPGDTLVIYPRADGEPYSVAPVQIDLPNITIRGEVAGDGKRVLLAGQRGRPSTEPQALITFGPDAHGGSVRDLILHGNPTSIGITVAGADRITISACELSGHAIGIASRGDNAQVRGLLLRDCHVHGNGTNVDLGGAEARLIGCCLEDSVDGPNLRSRSHRLLVEGGTIRRAARDEVDMLDAAGTTDRAGGYALFVGCILAKDPDRGADRGLLRIGQDQGGDRDTTVWLVHCTLVHPFLSPVIELTAPRARVALLNSMLIDPTGGGGGRRLIARRGHGPSAPDFLDGCWLAHGYAAPAGARQVTVGAFREQPPVRDAQQDWRWMDVVPPPFHDGGLDLASAPLPVAVLAADHPLRQRPPQLSEPLQGVGSQLRPVDGPPDLGAFEWTPQP